MSSIYSSDFMNLLRPSENVTVSSHPHPLRLKDAHETPYYCVGCNEKALGKCYECKDAENCHYHLHQQCYQLSESGYSSSIKFTFLESKKCDFVFQKEAAPGGGQRACDACGNNVKGWFYECKKCKKPHYLHPCCAHLPIKEKGKEGIALHLTAKTSSKCLDKDGMVLYLKENDSSVCLICGNKGDSRDFKSWVYVSRSGTDKYCYHVSCVKGKYENWNIDKASNQQKISYEAGTSSGAPNQDRKTRSGEKVDIFWEMAVDILIFVGFLIFGVTVPVPFGSMIKWLKRNN